MLTIATSDFMMDEGQGVVVVEEEEEEEEGQLDATKLQAASIEAEPPGQQATATSTTGDIAGCSASTGRSYECIFCKGGFSTAQALGGHMNIHRKDRARATKGTNSSTMRGSTEDGSEASYRHYHPYSLHRGLSRSFSSPAPVFSQHPPNKSNLSPDQCSADTASRSYNTEGRSSVEEDPSVVMRPREQSIFGEEELHLGLGLHRDGDHHDGECIKVGDDQEKELDLELRLGHDPK